MAPVRTALGLIFLGFPCLAAHLDAGTKRDFDRYVDGVEARVANRILSRAGRVEKIEAVNGGAWAVGDALFHDWRATDFVPGATKEQMLRLLKDYGHLSTHYAPDVVSSRVLVEDREGTTLAVRLRKKQGIAAVFDTEYRVRTSLVGENGGFSRSRSQHIWQVRDPGTSHEQRLREGDDDGFLWALDSYWSFRQVDDGLLIEFEAVSLTRNVPAGLGWLILPILRTLPRESLEFTLRATRDAPKEERFL